VWKWLAAAGFFVLCALGEASPQRLVLTGLPPWGPTVALVGGELVPAGCGPEAGRILLAYYDRRFGYARLVRPNPEGALWELRELMGTVTVLWGSPQGLTWPWKFAEGLEAFVRKRYPEGVKLGTFSGSLDQVFQKAVELLTQGKPAVVLFDWAGGGGILPTHYAVVVGYDRSQGRKHLLVNNGWGYDFQILDMADPAVAPAGLYWIEAILAEPDGLPGAQVGPPSAQGMWCSTALGERALCPVVRLHFSLAGTVRWPPSTSVRVLIPDTDLTVCLWH